MFFDWESNHGGTSNDITDNRSGTVYFKPVSSHITRSGLIIPIGSVVQWFQDIQKEDIPPVLQAIYLILALAPQEPNQVG
jgi:hypothetical protein